MKPSILKIIWTDWLALFSAVAIPVVWIIHIAFPHLKKGATAPIEIGIVLSILASISLIWRILRIQNFFGSGILTKGIFEEFIIVKDRGRFVYFYTIDGRDYHSWCAVHKTKKVRSFITGQEIEVFYQKSNHARSIVKDLFV
jgi:hypothetical protein